jgi:hypothetical protein
MPALEDYVLTKIAECGTQPLGEGFAALAGPEKTVSAEKAALAPPPSFFQFQPQQ